VATALINTSAQALLDPIRETFALSTPQLARLFGVSRQAIEQWRARGVPDSRQEKAAALAAIADLLRHRLVRERIPGIARRPAAAYGGLTMIEMVERDRHLELLESIRDAFDWTSTA